VLELPVGGTAVGSGINTHPEFGARVSANLAEQTGIAFIEAVNHFEGTPTGTDWSNPTGSSSASLKPCSDSPTTSAGSAAAHDAASTKSNCRHAKPGSSIMPGKVNPVMCESLMQLAARVIGNDATMTVTAVCGGNFQLNIMMPVMAHTSLESIGLLTGGCNAFIEFCLDELEPNEEACNAAIEQSLSMCTSFESVDRIRASRRAGQRSVQNRSNNSRTLRTKRHPARRPIGRSPSTRGK